MSVSLVSYGIGNLGSVANMLKRAGSEVRLVSTASELLSSERVLLPGVGAFDAGMARLGDQGLIEALRDFAASGRPMLGICLGMQLLFDTSEEGSSRGLGLIPGRSVKFSGPVNLRVPHMGWNTIAPVRSDSLVATMPEESRFYFVHSYHVVPERPEDIIATSEYGGSFVSMARAGNIMGAQFHPEKSHSFGLALLRNFGTE